jgi:SAM-dependent methyltransferase
VADVIREGDIVLDVGSGSGTDALIAAMLTGPTGTVHALDMTRAMRDKLRRNAAAMKAAHVHVLEGNAEQIPLPDASVDVITSNGVLNLVPDKRAAFGEIARSSAGWLAADRRHQPACRCRSSHTDPRLWAEWWLARSSRTTTSHPEGAGLDVEVIREMDYFAGSVSTSTRRAARGLGAHAIVMRGRRLESRTERAAGGPG